MLWSVFLIQIGCRGRAILLDPGIDAEERTMHLTTLFLIPVGLALAFLLWVLWNLTEQNNCRAARIRP